MKSVIVKLAGREYTVYELKARQNQNWRDQLKTRFTTLADVIGNAPSTELNTAGVSGLIRSVTDLVMDSIGDVREAILAYSPELSADREYIEANAYDSEIMDAFVEVLTLAFPFGGMVRKVGGLFESGPSNKPTSPK